MKSAAISFNEEQRLNYLHGLDLLDSPHEKDFDDIVKLASQICKVPIALIALVDANRHWFKARVGVDLDESSREDSFCDHVNSYGDHLEIPDTLQDERFIENPWVINDPKIRFYAGFPLVTKNGFRIGTLCVLDTVSRRLNDDQRFGLQVLSSQIINLVELRLKNKKTEIQIEEAKKHQLLLEDFTHSQSKIISYIAHDVRNPLSALKGIIDMNDLHLLTPKQVDDVMGMLNKQLDGTLDMLTNLVEWGQAHIHRQIPHTRGVNLYEVVQKKFKNLEVAAQLKGNTLKNEVEEGFMVFADEYILRFILRNLLSNANKFTSQGTITVSVTRKGDNALIKVTDNGVGISEKVMKKLFNPDKRSTNPGTNNEKGSGLGLVLAREFVEKLDSNLHIESEEGKGAAFSFSLPVYHS
jgi:signal transduction histidine kinase